MVRTTFKSVPRAELARIITKGIAALADPANYSNFELSIDTDGDESTIERVKMEVAKENKPNSISAFLPEG